VSWELRVDPSVLRQLRKFPSKDAKRILDAIDGMAFNPYAGDIERMRGEEDVWRRRIGSYRVLYEVITSHRIVHAFRVVRRTSITY
jgi:mRNA interferase RelE/StbE